MDVETLGAALALAKKAALPKTTAEDEGATLVVGADGKWTKGEVIPNTISVSSNKLVISAE